MRKFTLDDFIIESNRIEGIYRDVLPIERVAHERFLSRSRINIDDLSTFVAMIQPGALIRNKKNMDVMVGNHIPPRGGDYIQATLFMYLSCINDLMNNIVNGRSYESAREHNAWLWHNRYETLHPFTDGNGRSGRVLWLWMMGGIKNVPLGFLHTFYYQTLAWENLGTNNY